jgi:UDP-N-acetylmuramoyl-tripeptide--D-alanyl-D-alanine ligase
MMVGGIRVIADCYNSNPASLAAALELLADLPSPGEKVAVLGTMKEMGSDSARIHERSAREVAERVGSGVDRVVATGEFVEAFAAVGGELGDRLIAEEDVVDAYARVAPTLEAGSTLLLKGSRGVALERWLDRLREERGADTPDTREG